MGNIIAMLVCLICAAINIPWMLAGNSWSLASFFVCTALALFNGAMALRS